MKKRVMLVEDEEFILQGILCIVDWKTIDMEVAYTAHNGKEALEKFREDPVDIIVTDVEMPLMDGLELIREIRGADFRGDSEPDRERERNYDLSCRRERNSFL